MITMTTKLYSTLAKTYHEMYQNIFDYDKEFEFYVSILEKNKCKKILEIGCGSGMLARRFIKTGYNYTGMDLYDEMLQIARKEIGIDKFVQGDMRKLNYDKEFDAVLITGRSIGYVIDNIGILNTLKGVYKALITGGLFIFGVFEANGIFSNMEDFEQKFDLPDKTITRKSQLKPNLTTGWTWDWKAKYIINQNGKTTETNDFTTLRAFTKDEISLFLKLSGFDILKIIEESKTLTIIARQKR